VRVVTAITLGVAALSAASSPPDHFVRANGITLQYVDWGGKGDVVLFLPGLGDDVHRFDTFAPRFSECHDTNHFFFTDPRKTDTVVAEIRLFLSQP